jgi:site-specific DNA-cytosine methylase
LLDRAFEAEGFTVVRGPDPIFGGDIRDFHVPADRFDGIIGGPPCQHWTRLMFLNPNAGKGMGWVVNEYARVVEEAQPEWFVMEEVLYAPMPLVAGYHVWDVVLSDDDVGGVQPRTRRISFGTHDGRMLHVVRHEKNGQRAGTVMATDSGIAYEEKRRVAQSVLTERVGTTFSEGQRPEDRKRKQSVLADSRAVPVKLLAGGKEKRSVLSSGVGAHGGGRGEGFEGGRLPGGRKATVLAGNGPVGRGGEQYETNLSIEDMCEYQGLPRDFTDKMPFTMSGKRAAIGNGVPQAMGRAIARAVRLATEVRA